MGNVNTTFDSFSLQLSNKTRVHNGMLLDMKRVHRLQSNVKIGLGHARKMLAATDVVQEANAPYLSSKGDQQLRAEGGQQTPQKRDAC